MASDPYQLTTKRRRRPRDELSEVVPPHRLQRRSVLEQEPSRGEEHLVCVPRRRSIVEHVAGVPRPTVRTIVHGIEVVDASDDVRRECRVVDDQSGHPGVEGRGLFGRGKAEVVKCLAIECSFIELSCSGVLLETSHHVRWMKTYVGSPEIGHMEIVPAENPL